MSLGSIQDEEEEENMKNNYGLVSPPHCSLNNTDERTPKNIFRFLLTNARSLAPKIDSFIENFHERDINLCIATETWLAEGSAFSSTGRLICVWEKV